MNYLDFPKNHYKPAKGWVNDPNGLVYYKGYYHVFYQHCPDSEKPVWPMYWGHARTKDFINWEELPCALVPDHEYDRDGCWSGTAMVKDDVLYLYYASIRKDPESDGIIQSVSVATSRDGVTFEKYSGNPIISGYPADGCPDFRDPAVICIDSKVYCVMASGYRETKKGRLLLYAGEDPFNLNYKGIMAEWDNCNYTECPSFTKFEDKYLLSVSVCPIDSPNYFYVMVGEFKNGVFTPEIESEIDKGPDQYAGQIFRDNDGRNLHITWLPGWEYVGLAEKDVGCMSVPREISIKDGKLCGYPAKEVGHLIKKEDSAVQMTDDGFVIKRTGRDDVRYVGRVDDIAIIRDKYLVEVFVNGGESIYSVLL